MDNERLINNRKITDMLQKMMQQGGHYIVDINRQLHYFDTPDEPIRFNEKKSSVSKTLYIYDTDIKDPEACILNPLLETMVESLDRRLFYSLLSEILSQWIFKILYFIVTESAKQKDNKSDLSDPALVPILTPFINKVDATMEKELDLIKGGGYKNFCILYYNRSKKSATLLTGLEDETEEYMKSFGKDKIRKKSWNLFLKIVKFILKVPNDKKIKELYVYKTENVECPNFTTFANVWIQAWECIDPYLDYFKNHHSDKETIEALKEHISNVSVYHKYVTWLGQVSDEDEDRKPSRKALTAPTASGKQAPSQKEPSWKMASNSSMSMPVSVQVAPVQVASSDQCPAWARYNTVPRTAVNIPIQGPSSNGYQQVSYNNGYNNGYNYNNPYQRAW